MIVILNASEWHRVLLGTVAISLAYSSVASGSVRLAGCVGINDQ